MKALHGQRVEYKIPKIEGDGNEIRWMEKIAEIREKKKINPLRFQKTH